MSSVFGPATHSPSGLIPSPVKRNMRRVISNGRFQPSALLAQTLRKPEDPYLIGNAWGGRERTEPREGQLAARRGGPAGHMDGRWIGVVAVRAPWWLWGFYCLLGCLFVLIFFCFLSKITSKLVKKSNVTIKRIIKTTVPYPPYSPHPFPQKQAMSLNSFTVSSPNMPPYFQIRTI